MAPFFTSSGWDKWVKFDKIVIYPVPLPFIPLRISASALFIFLWTCKAITADMTDNTANTAAKSVILK